MGRAIVREPSVFMRSGVLQQCADPQTLYDRPDNIFVGAFIGSPAINLYEVVVGEAARSLKLGSQTITLPDQVSLAHPGLRAFAGRTAIAGLRPEHLPAHDGGDGPMLEADVDLVEALGSELLAHFTLDAKGS